MGDLIEHFTVTWLARVGDLGDLSRPIRKRSHYPTLLALQNALQKAIQTNEETRQMVTALTQELTEILEHVAANNSPAVVDGERPASAGW